MAIVELNQENLSKCLCPNCPSYSNCARKIKEYLYCAQAVGNSKCLLQMNGCICAECPLRKEKGIKFGYYCVYGSADSYNGKPAL